MDKTISSLAEAVAGIKDGATVMIGGFGGSGAGCPRAAAMPPRRGRYLSSPSARSAACTASRALTCALNATTFGNGARSSLT